MVLTAQDRRTIADKDKALAYCRSFYLPRLNALNSMAFAAQTAATTFLSKITEPNKKTVTEEFGEVLFGFALGSIPGALPLAKFWKRLDDRHPYFADRAKAFIGVATPSAVKLVAAGSPPENTHTDLLRKALVKIGTKIGKGRKAVTDEWSRAASSILDWFQKGQPNLTGKIQKTLGPLPVWLNIQKPLTDAYDRELFKKYVATFVTVHTQKFEGWGPSGKDTLILDADSSVRLKGINNTVYGYIKKRFPEIKSEFDLHKEWGAKLELVDFDVAAD